MEISVSLPASHSATPRPPTTLPPCGSMGGSGRRRVRWLDHHTHDHTHEDHTHNHTHDHNHTAFVPEELGARTLNAPPNSPSSQSQRSTYPWNPPSDSPCADVAHPHDKNEPHNGRGRVPAPPPPPSVPSHPHPHPNPNLDRRPRRPPPPMPSPRGRGRRVDRGGDRSIVCSLEPSASPCTHGLSMGPSMGLGPARPPNARTILPVRDVRMQIHHDPHTCGSDMEPAGGGAEPWGDHDDPLAALSSAFSREGFLLPPALPSVIEQAPPLQQWAPAAVGSAAARTAVDGARLSTPRMTKAFFRAYQVM